MSSRLQARGPELISSLTRRLREDFPAFEADPALSVGRSEHVSVSLRALVTVLEGGDKVAPEWVAHAVDEARAAAQAGLDLGSLVLTYRVVHAAVWDALLTETVHAVPDPQQHLAVLQYVSHAQFDWNDAVVMRVISAYEQERRSLQRPRDRQLRAALQDLLTGRSVMAPAADYPFTHGTHLAVVAWGQHPHEAVEALAGDLVFSKKLEIPGISGAVLAWFALTAGEPEIRPAQDLVLPPESHVAFGMPAPDLQGFRRTHLQAWRAYRVSLWTAAPLTYYPDVSLDALLLRDVQVASDLVEQQLGGLDADDPRTDMLCETMRAYFRSGCNASTAAVELGVHERTVSYRLRSIEDRLGVDVATHRTELGVALRLRELVRSISRSAGSGGVIPWTEDGLSAP